MGNCPITCNILVLTTFRVFRELGGGLNELGGGGWSWAEVVGGGWSWMELDGGGCTV